MNDPNNGPVLAIKHLDVDFWVDGVWYPAVSDASFKLSAGEVLAIVGESGSGKSTIALAAMGLLPKNSHTGGSIVLDGTELVGIDQRTLRSFRGRVAAMIFQEPMTALNPVYTIGFQIAEMLRSHQAMTPKAARRRAIELLEMVEIPEPERRVDSFPHQLSGGQRQRAMIAQSLALEPRLLIADEPTTALDVTVQAEILKLMRDLRDRIDAGVLLITHDMGVVADLSDRVLVMKDGRIVESGSVAKIFYEPKDPYTQELLGAVPYLGKLVESAVTEDMWKAREPVPDDSDDAPPPETEFLVDLRNVSIEYPKHGRTPAFRAVDQISLNIAAGEVVGLVGESGSGKTTVGRAIVGLLPFVEGDATVLGEAMTNISKKKLRELRGGLSFVFQDPGSSLNPRLPVGESIAEPLLLAKVGPRDRTRRVEELLDQVQLSRSLRNRYPHELSGGQRQRVGVARALALNPRLLIADEPTSALDVSVQASVLEIFQELQQEFGFACLFISHDLAVVEILASRIAVMENGKLVEFGSREQILTAPREAYTKRLLAAVPVPDPDAQRSRRVDRDALIAAGARERD
jgi:peptide/nickel transport system ATP-binding protein